MSEAVFIDAGVFIGALLSGDARHAEARPLVEAARAGSVSAATSVAVLCEVYAALTWERAMPRHNPGDAADAVRLLIEPPSAIRIVGSGVNVAVLTMQLAARHGLSARKTHDAHHAAAAICGGIRSVYSYDTDDWRQFEPDGLRIAGPQSSLVRLGR